ncbi:MAG: type II/IV secretion system protein [Opitutae bacterium]|nr:type II/IV secretion system protein [Opitutae bacterium]
MTNAECTHWFVRLAGALGAEKWQALEEGPRSRRPVMLAEAMARSESSVATLLTEITGLPLVADPRIDESARSLLPARLAESFQVAPIQIPDCVRDSRVHLAVSWPPDAVVDDWIAAVLRRPVCWHIAPGDRLQKLLRENYGVGAGSLDEESDPGLPVRQEEQTEDADAAVVRFVTEIISQAVGDGATDIHFEPLESGLRIRYRVDGLLVPVPLPANLSRYQDAIISRLKIMARLNISEKRLPQDGRINFRIDRNALDIRVSTVPTIYAESVSLRLLNHRKEAYTMERIGLGAAEQQQVMRALGRPHGIILVTGPTGSGKSTSLNAFLRQINSTDLRIVTVEDPIEYEVPGANQIQVRPEIGLSFASVLRHILRQDPDVIMVGEIRDRETADIAIRASLTGHLVFSTLHTNEAPGAITRLIDMGIEPFLVASAVEIVIAQRLVRRLCPQCARPVTVSRTRLRDNLASLGVDPVEAEGVESLLLPQGCDHCRGTGFRGRVGLFEILQTNEEIQDLIVRREPTRALTRCAVKHGMRPLALSGWQKVREGETTMDEVLRVITASDS